MCQYHIHNCTQNLLNGIKADCTLIKERMHSIEEIDNGKILLHGTHKINNITKTGTFLLLFNETVVIDNLNYTNEKNLVLEYLQRNKPTQYEILNIIESENEQLKIPKMSIIEKIPIEMNEHPIRSFFITLAFIIFVILLMHYLIQFCKIYQMYRSNKAKEQANNHVRALFDRKSRTISFNDGES